MDLKLFILLSIKSAPSKERSGCVQGKMKPPSLNNRHLHRSRTKEITPPTHLMLTSSKSKEDEEIEQVSPCTPEFCKSSQSWAVWVGEFCTEDHLTKPLGSEM